MQGSKEDPMQLPRPQKKRKTKCSSSRWRGVVQIPLPNRQALQFMLMRITQELDDKEDTGRRRYLKYVKGNDYCKWHLRWKEDGFNQLLFPIAST